MVDKNSVLLGRRIRDLRVKRGLSQERLSELCGISSRHISELERGKSNPGYQLLESLSRALGISAPELLNFAHHRKPEEIRRDMLEMVGRLEGESLRVAYRMLRALSE